MTTSSRFLGLRDDIRCAATTAGHDRRGPSAQRARLALLATLVALAACSGHRPPVVEDKIGGNFGFNEELGTFAIAPDYSVAFVQLSNTEHRMQGDSGNRFCAQAPADAASELSSAFSGAVKAASESGQTIDLSAAGQFASAIRQLFVRSQGVQLYRDGSFAVCNAYLNDALTKQQYNDQLEALRMTAQALIHEQIPYIHLLQTDPHSMPPERRLTPSTTDLGSGAP